jgi:hypothetical protein
MAILNTSNVFFMKSFDNIKLLLLIRKQGGDFKNKFTIINRYLKITSPQIKKLYHCVKIPVFHILSEGLH